MRKEGVKLQSRDQIIRLHSFFFTLMLACLFAACGSNGGGTTTTGSTPSPTSTPSRVAIPNRTNSCPAPAPTSPPAVKPNVVIKLTNSNSTVTARNGDLIEVLLPANEQWSGPTSSRGILVPQSPSGYPLQGEKLCVWHFVAHGTGATTLTFSGRAICKAGQMCPMYVIEIPFRVVVK